jgi:hypothetical protein
MENTVARTPDETPELPPQLADLPAQISEFLRSLRSEDSTGQVAATAVEYGYRLGLAAQAS